MLLIYKFKPKFLLENVEDSSTFSSIAEFDLLDNLVLLHTADPLHLSDKTSIFPPILT